MFGFGSVGSSPPGLRDLVHGAGRYVPTCTIRISPHPGPTVHCVEGACEAEGVQHPLCRIQELIDVRSVRMTVLQAHCTIRSNARVSLFENLTAKANTHGCSTCS